MAFVSTLGASNANSYISVEKAEERVGELPQSDGLLEWLSLVDTDKQKTLTAATFSIDPLGWKGYICSSSQNLAWPRTISLDGKSTTCSELPYDFELAVAYTAAFMGQLGGYMQVAPGGGSVPQSGEEPIPGLSPESLSGYEKVSLGSGAIELTLSQPGKIQTGVQYLPPFTVDILSKYVKDLGKFSVISMPVPASTGLRVPFITPGGSGHRFQMVDGRIFAQAGYSLSDLSW